MLSGMFKAQLQKRVEDAVENNLGGLVGGIGEKLTAALVEANRPLMSGMAQVREVVKSSEVGQIHENRKAKLEK